MKLVITEKHDAASKIAKLLGSKVKSDKVYNTPVYRFTVAGEEWVTIGLRGHILGPDFTPKLQYNRNGGWTGICADEKTKIKAEVPKGMPKPPYKTRRKPFLKDGIDLKSWKMEALPYLTYSPIEKLAKEKAIIRSLKNLAKKADSVVIATDFDREGELIGSDALACVREVNPQIPAQRARYSAFTQAEIDNAFQNLVELDTNLADAGGSRQDIDLIWGAVLTRYLTLVRFAGYGNVRSAGRVQTPTLALVCEKERERLAFKPEDYWVIDASFGDAPKKVEMTEEAEKRNAFGRKPDPNPLPDGAFVGVHETARFKDEAAAQAVMADIDGATQASVTDIQKKSRKVAPPVPFNTTSLMAAASSEGISPGRTMRIAESLYMAGLISYPRVDNTVYPASLNLSDVVKTLSKNPAYSTFCNILLGKGPLHATRGKKETTDHPPIYPTAAADQSKLSGADWKIYNLIARRFLATLSDAAVLEGTKVTLEINGQNFHAKGDIMQHAGFRAIYPYGSREDVELPDMQVGDTIKVNGSRCTAKQTQPPARYSQGRLVQEMEKLGLGTKSTRASIIDRLYQVKYIQNDPIEPSQLGMAVCAALEKFAPEITHSQMTSQLEAEMDDIAEGKTSRDEVVLDSRNRLAGELDNLMPHAAEISEALADAVAADAYVGKCPKCGKDLQIKISNKTRSQFIGCAGWPDCDVTYPLPQGKIEALDEKCPVCGMAQIKVTPFRQKARTLCIDPNCDSNKEPDVVVGICPTCKAKGIEAELIAKRNPRTLKRFIRCENYDDCGTGYPLPQYGAIEATGEVCPDCGAPMVNVVTNRGPWKICPNFSCPSKDSDKAKRPARGRKR